MTQGETQPKCSRNAFSDDLEVSSRTAGTAVEDSPALARGRPLLPRSLRAYPGLAASAPRL